MKVKILEDKRKIYKATAKKYFKRATENKYIFCSVTVLLVSRVLLRALPRKVGYLNSKPRKYLEKMLC